MSTIDLTSENFESTIDNNDIVILDFWAPWCGPCKTFGPIFESVSEKHSDISFGKINTEDQQELAAKFGIRSIPTLAVFRGKIPVFMNPGMVPAEALEDLITQVKGLDMTAVKKDYDEQMAKTKA